MAADSKDKEEDLPTAGLDNSMWDEEPVLDSREYLCSHEIPRQAIPQPAPATPLLQPAEESLPHHPSTKWK